MGFALNLNTQINSIISTTKAIQIAIIVFAIIDNRNFFYREEEIQLLIFAKTNVKSKNKLLLWDIIIITRAFIYRYSGVQKNAFIDKQMKSSLLHTYNVCTLRNLSKSTIDKCCYRQVLLSTILNWIYSENWYKFLQFIQLTYRERYMYTLHHILIQDIRI